MALAATAQKAEPRRYTEAQRRVLREMRTRIREKDRRMSRRFFYAMFPDQTTIWDGPSLRELVTRGEPIWARQLYPKHMEFFAQGRIYPERAARCANRVGKTVAMGGYETTCHLTGLYPEWWPGRRFGHEISAWVAGRTFKTTAEIMQTKLLGKVIGKGPSKRLSCTGLIPGELVGEPTWQQGFASLVDTVPIKHDGGGWSDLTFKCFEQGRSAFEGTEKHVVWGDEQMPVDVYSECLIRTMTVNGIIYITFTPLQGMDGVVLEFLEPEYLHQNV